jgi:hypothetical protein
MKFEEALTKIKGAESVGGQLIVVRDGAHILVGKDVQGTLIVEDTAEAKQVMLEVGVKVDVEVQKEALEDAEEEAKLHPAPHAPPQTHEVNVHDKVETQDKASGKK